MVQKTALQHSQPMYRIALLEKITLRPSASVVLYLQFQTHACRLQQGNVQLLDCNCLICWQCLVLIAALQREHAW